MSNVGFVWSFLLVLTRLLGKSVLLKEVIMREKALRGDKLFLLSGSADSMDMGTPFFAWTDILINALELGKTKDTDALKGNF